MFVPCAAACPYYVPYKLANPTGKPTHYRALRTLEDFMPVIPTVTGEAMKRNATVRLTRDEVARKDDVRRGDCYLFDLTLEHSPRVIVEGNLLGRAVSFGGVDEMIDTARCRLVFADLPSA
jgi:hypothetical protein